MSVTAVRPNRSRLADASKGCGRFRKPKAHDSLSDSVSNVTWPASTAISYKSPASDASSSRLVVGGGSMALRRARSGAKISATCTTISQSGVREPLHGGGEEGGGVVGRETVVRFIIRLWCATSSRITHRCCNSPHHASLLAEHQVDALLERCASR
jgi:hypothetical protein